MPTDLLHAIARRRSRERGAFWRDSAIVLTIAVLGSTYTIMRALQSESFAATLYALGGD